MSTRNGEEVLIDMKEEFHPWLVVKEVTSALISNVKSIACVDTRQRSVNLVIVCEFSAICNEALKSLEFVTVAWFISCW